MYPEAVVETLTMAADEVMVSWVEATAERPNGMSSLTRQEPGEGGVSAADVGVGWWGEEPRWRIGPVWK